jgi:hypothetical protein
MNKLQLLKALEEVEDKAEIILSSDEEGNDFGKLWSVECYGNSAILYPASGTVEQDEDGTLSYEVGSVEMDEGVTRKSEKEARLLDREQRMEWESEQACRRQAWGLSFGEIPPPIPNVL